MHKSSLHVAANSIEDSRDSIDHVAFVRESFLRVRREDRVIGTPCFVTNPDPVEGLIDGARVKPSCSSLMVTGVLAPLPGFALPVYLLVHKNNAAAAE